MKSLDDGASGEDSYQDDDQDRDDMADRFHGAKILNCVNEFHNRVTSFLGFFLLRFHQ